jgi:outer membrane lipoprotein LolB
MLITTPTGQGVAQILRQGDAVLLRTSEPREYRAADSEELTQRVLGFPLPIEGLAQTVQGRPSPASSTSFCTFSGDAPTDITSCRPSSA